MKFLALLIILLFNVFLYFLLMFQKIQQLCLWPSLEFDFSSYTFLANRSSAWRIGFGEKYALKFFLESTKIQVIFFLFCSTTEAICWKLYVQNALR